jgi:fructuronate reductase
MVDRLTPATTEEDHELATSLLGLRDEALVVTEPFRQWVIEDRFAGPRPAWELAGAILTSDVAPYEQAKLRILNGAHSMLAYLGALAGYETIAEAVADEPIRSAVLRVLDADILPTVTAPPGIDLTEYRDSVVHRFANPQLKHTTRQVAMDGSHKVPLRWLEPARERVAAGLMPHGVAIAVAAWISYVAETIPARDGGTNPAGSTLVEPAGLELDDPMAAELTAAVGRADAPQSEPDALVRRFFAVDGIFPTSLRNSSAFRRAVVDAFPTVAALTSP